MKPKKFIYNPHYNPMVGRTLGDFFKSSKIPVKHNFLKNLIKKNKLSILISGNHSSLGRYSNNRIVSKFIFLIDRFFYKYFQIYLWVIINGINPLKVNIVFDLQKLHKEDIPIIYANLNCLSNVKTN